MSVISTGAQVIDFTSIGSSVNLDDMVHDGSLIVEDTGTHLVGSVTVELPVEIISTSHAGGIQESSFLNQFYFRLWVIPSTVNLGRVLGTINTTVEVWNSFFTEKDCDAISTVGDTTGLTLTGDETSPYAALESRIYTLTATLEGSPKIDVTYDFNFKGSGDIASVLRVLGTRIVAFLLRHNWASPILEQLAFKTDILSALSGKEQARKLRQIPRRRIEMSYLTLDQFERAYLENAMQGHNLGFAIPLWSDASPLTATATAGASTISVDTATRDYQIGSFVFITDGVQYEAVEIASFTGSSITLTEPLANTYIIGSKVCPARFGVLDARQDISRITSHHDEVRLVWLLDSDQDRPNQLTAYTPVTYQGLEVYDEQNDYSRDLAIAQSADRTDLDNEIGLTGILTREPHPRQTYPFQKLMLRSELGKYLQWFYNRSGKLVPFWWVDHVPAFHLTAGATFDSVFLTVRSNGYAQFSFGNPARRNIAIKVEGSWLYREIVGVTDNGDGTTTLELDSAPGVELSADDNLLICFLRKVRLESDILEITYETSGDGIRTATRFRDVL